MSAAAPESPATPSTGPLLEVRGLSKAFPGCLANDAVSLHIAPGEVHALLGENGAGKSTLVRMMYGVLAPDEGEILWRGQAVRLGSPADARKLGIGMVFQHLSLFDPMTVLENVALAMPADIKPRALRERIIRVSADYGLPLDPDRVVHTLSVGERQRIEVVRCLLLDPDLLILDEPTSVLTPQEAEQLFAAIARIRAEGRSVLYISHKLHEVQQICQRATVLREGRVVAECDPRAENPASLAEMMLGSRVVPSDRRRRTTKMGPPRLEVEAVSVQSGRAFGFDLKDVSLSVRGGEILGVAGIAGNGQKELMRVLIGEVRLPGAADAIRIDGKPVGRSGPIRRRLSGMAFVPEERNGHAAAPELPLTENAFLSGFAKLGLTWGGLIRKAPTRSFTQSVIEAYRVRAQGPDADAGSLSGGNLQKFIVGREVMQDPGVLVVSQPTWGVDPGAAQAIRQALLDLAAGGAAVLMISQDLDEIFQICDRVVVMSEGRLSAAHDIDKITTEEIGLLMGGIHGQGGAAA